MMHVHCFKAYTRRNFKCPVCNKTLEGVSFNLLDQEVRNTPMPPEYSNFLAEIHCNDCNKGSTTRLHFVGLKCRLCGSYNTSRDKVYPAPVGYVFQEDEPNLPAEGDNDVDDENEGGEVLEESDDQDAAATSEDD